mgnify:FL=1
MMFKKCPYCGKEWLTAGDLFIDKEARYLGQWDFEHRALWCWYHAAPGCGTTFTLDVEDIRRIFEHLDTEEARTL